MSFDCQLRFKNESGDMYAEPKFTNCNNSRMSDKILDKVNQNQTKPVQLFQVKCTTPYSLEGLTSELKGRFKVDVCKDRHQLPTYLKKGSDFDDPCLWEPDAQNIFITKV